jgi:hypothetical protein
VTTVKAQGSDFLPVAKAKSYPPTALMTGLDRELEITLRAMEAGFHVRLISTFDPELVYAPPESDARDWLAGNYPEFDQFPVRHERETIGILLRDGQHNGKTVREAMRPLREGLIVSTHMPIAELIPQLRENHFRLVLRGSSIDGLVTQSDLVKLPVRMLVFGFISHFELLLRALIRKHHVEEGWLDRLENNARGRIIKLLQKLRSERLEPDPLELTLFSDTLHIAGKLPDLGEELIVDSECIEDLRNDIAHAKTFITAPADVRTFVDRFEKLRNWIERVAALLNR